MNPFRGVKEPIKPLPQIMYLSDDEIFAIANKMFNTRQEMSDFIEDIDDRMFQWRNHAKMQAIAKQVNDLKYTLRALIKQVK